MTTGKLSPKGENGLSHSAWLVLAIAGSLLVLSIVQIIYRFTLPTDGWSVYVEEIEAPDWIYLSNLVGAPSGLQPYDRLLSVDERSLEGTDTGTMPPPQNWQVGNSVTMLLQRGNRQVSVEVPVVHWNARAVWYYLTHPLSQLASIVGGLIFLAIGWFTFLRRSEVPSARALLMFSTAFGAIAISGLLPDGLSVQFDQLATITTGFFSYVIFGTLLVPSLLTFSLLFPNPKRLIQRQPWIAFLPYVTGLVLFIYLISGGSGIAGWVTAMILLIASLVSLVHAGLTQRDVISRLQLRWAISGFALGLGLLLLNYPVAFGWITHPLLVNLFLSVASLGIAVIGIGMAVAVLRYRLYGIDVIIQRTLVYAVVTTLSALVYFGSVVLLQSLVGGVSGQQSPISIVISTLLIAALFTPLRRRVQDFIDRRFYRRKYDAALALESFATTARDETDVEHLTAELVRVVQETMQPESVGLWIAPLFAREGSTLEGRSGGIARD